MCFKLQRSADSDDESEGIPGNIPVQEKTWQCKHVASDS